MTKLKSSLLLSAAMALLCTTGMTNSAMADDTAAPAADKPAETAKPAPKKTAAKKKKLKSDASKVIEKGVEDASKKTSGH